MFLRFGKSIIIRPNQKFSRKFPVVCLIFSSCFTGNNCCRKGCTLLRPRILRAKTPKTANNVFLLRRNDFHENRSFLMPKGGLRNMINYHYKQQSPFLAFALCLTLLQSFFLQILIFRHPKYHA